MPVKESVRKVLSCTGSRQIIVYLLSYTCVEIEKYVYALLYVFSYSKCALLLRTPSCPSKMLAMQLDWMGNLFCWVLMVKPLIASLNAFLRCCVMVIFFLYIYECSPQKQIYLITNQTIISDRPVFKLLYLKGAYLRARFHGRFHCMQFTT